MHLILGGYAQGRLSFALQKYDLTPEDVWDAAAEPFVPWQGQRLIYHAEALVTRWIQAGETPEAMLEPILSQWQNTVVITQEVGCGLVPISAEERAWRDAVGTLNQRLAGAAKIVDRVCCGIGMRLKNSGED